jgi:putative tryptophan/tyrosine transport system substrate-binding protein
MTRYTRRHLMQGTGTMGLALLAGCGRLPGQAQARATRVHHIGYLGTPLPPSLRERLEELGYVEGQNLLVEYRDPDGQTERLPDLAAELAALPLQVIVANGVGAARAAQGATSTIPIVGMSGDLVEDGLVESYARPGGNVTGPTLAIRPLIGKRIQLLMETVGSVARLAMLGGPPSQRLQLDPRRHYDEAAQTLGIELLAVSPQTPDQLEAAFQRAVERRADALYVVATVLSVAHRARVVALAAEYRLPAIYEIPVFVRDGGLMTYSGSQQEMHRRAAGFVDKILKGARPADLPVEQTREFDFVINLRTAQALGLTIPQHILLQATEVLQ